MPTTSAQPVVLRWTRFKSDSDGNGAEKRAAQNRWLGQTGGVEVVDLVPPMDFPRWRARLIGGWLRLRLGRHASVDPAGAGLLGYRHWFFDESLKRHPSVKLVVWETTYDDVLPLVARRHGKRLLAVPHNLEAFVSERVFADAAYDPFPDLSAEVRRLAQADAVFTISREERWLLETRGVAASYLPYFPEPKFEAECLALRARRRPASAATPLLMLGSAFNAATARGMRQHLEWLRESLRPVVVVGPQTDRLFADFANDRVRVLGAVPRARLAELLASSMAMLIHTTGGAGAVTRIPEALLAGLPVIANSNALRDCHGVAGTHRYENHGEFLNLAAQSLPTPPPPARPVREEAFFRATLRQLAGLGASASP